MECKSYLKSFLHIIYIDKVKIIDIWREDFDSNTLLPNVRTLLIQFPCFNSFWRPWTSPMIPNNFLECYVYVCFDFVKFKYANCILRHLIYYAYNPETRCTAVYSNTIVTLCIFVVYVLLCNQHMCVIRTVLFTVLRNTYTAMRINLQNPIQIDVCIGWCIETLVIILQPMWIATLL